MSTMVNLEDFKIKVASGTVLDPYQATTVATGPNGFEDIRVWNRSSGKFVGLDTDDMLHLALGYAVERYIRQNRPVESLVDLERAGSDE